jgi:FtsZ-binding cell division protein ZapB
LPTADTKKKLERLDALESKVSKAAETVAELHLRCRKLAQDRERLEKDVADLTDRNNDLAQQVVGLNAKRERGSGRAAQEKKILRKIDRMIEKFGELQV